MPYSADCDESEGFQQSYRNIESRLQVSRREFVKFCAGVAATLGLPASMAPRIAEAVEHRVEQAATRPAVIWLSGQECTGCTESLLRSNHPTVERLIMDMISLDYHYVLAAAAGHQVNAAKKASMKANKGNYLLVVDGAVPTKDGGIYCKIAERPFIEHVQEAAEHAAAIISIGSCAAWGGIPASGPNPTGAVGVGEVLPGKTVINVPGCPPNPYNFLSTVIHFLTLGTLPELDQYGRPTFAYGRLIHEHCERRAHFDAGRFAKRFGDEGHRQGWCLYKLGCKGPETYANCPVILYGDVGSGSWPVGTGHPCFGCSEQGVGFTKATHELATVKTHTPPNAFPRTDEPRGQGASVTAAALLAAAGGALLGATAAGALRLKRDEGRASDAVETHDPALPGGDSAGRDPASRDQA